MKIVSAIVLQQRHGADIVSLQTDLPEPCHPFTGPLYVDFRCARGDGVRYLFTHFPDVTPILLYDRHLDRHVPVIKDGVVDHGFASHPVGVQCSLCNAKAKDQR